LIVFELPRDIQRCESREYRAAEATQREPASLFAGPCDGLDRMLRYDLSRVEQLERAQCSDDAVRAVVGAAGFHGVEMGPDENRRKIRFGAVTAREEVSNGVLGDGIAAISSPRREVLACGAFLRRRESAVDSAFVTAELRKLRETIDDGVNGVAPEDGWRSSAVRYRRGGRSTHHHAAARDRESALVPRRGRDAR